MNPLAKELNDLLTQNAATVFHLLSAFGQRLFFPKGIITQSQEAKTKGHLYNATLGIATEENLPMFFPSINSYINGLDPKDVFPYAPGAGKPELRKIWKNKVFNDNPSTRNKEISLPIVTCGITHGLNIFADLFIDPNDQLILPDKFWGNYKLIFETRCQGKISTFPLFNNNNGFNLKAFEKHLKLVGKEQDKIIILFNFPNNPTGYTPTIEEVKAIQSIVLNQAEKGNDIIVVTDDAYFNLFYENSIKESLFGYFIGLHPNILAIKLDGATKENYAWGFRVGFITFGLGQNNNFDEVYTVLEKKVMGAIRSQLSNAPHLSQTLILKNLESKEFQNERNVKFEVMKKRALKVKEVLNNPKFDPYWSIYPFNSGYFMCLKLKTVNAEIYRQHLLNNYGIGVISSNETDIRIAFSCVGEEKLQDMFEIMFTAIKKLN